MSEKVLRVVATQKRGNIIKENPLTQSLIILRHHHVVYCGFSGNCYWPLHCFTNVNSTMIKLSSQACDINSHSPDPMLRVLRISESFLYFPLWIKYDTAMLDGSMLSRVLYFFKSFTLREIGFGSCAHST